MKEFAEVRNQLLDWILTLLDSVKPLETQSSEAIPNILTGLVVAFYS